MSYPLPDYPELPRADKWRRLANSRDLTPDERCAYGDAVLEGIRTLRRQELARTSQSHRWNCASGTAHNTGEEILAAVGRQNRAALERAAQADRKRRTDDEIREAYVTAMAEKRAAAMVSVPVAPAEPAQPRSEAKQAHRAPKARAAVQRAPEQLVVRLGPMVHPQVWGAGVAVLGLGA